MKYKIRMFLSVAMFILFILLMFGYDMSRYFHEISGIFLFCAVTMHIIIDIIYLKALFKKVKREEFYVQDGLKFLTDVVLFILFPITIMTGLMMSIAIFDFGYRHDIFLIHKYVAWLTVMILAYHIFSNRKFIV